MRFTLSALALAALTLEGCASSRSAESSYSRGTPYQLLTFSEDDRELDREIANYAFREEALPDSIFARAHQLYEAPSKEVDEYLSARHEWMRLAFKFYGAPRVMGSPAEKLGQLNMQTFTLMREHQDLFEGEHIKRLIGESYFGIIDELNGNLAR